MKQTESYSVGGWVQAATGRRRPTVQRNLARQPLDDIDAVVRGLTRAEHARWVQFWRSVCWLTGQRMTFHRFVRGVLTTLKAKMDAEPGRWVWDGGWTLREAV